MGAARDSGGLRDPAGAWRGPSMLSSGSARLDLIEQVERRGFCHLCYTQTSTAPRASRVIPGSQESMPYKDPKKHRDYYKNYMHRRRAGLAKAKPKPKAKLPRRPSRRLVETVRHWQYLGQHRPLHLRQPARAMIDGLDLTTDEGVFAACRRYQAHLAAPCAARKREEQEREAAKKAPARCSFCRERASPDRILVGEGIYFICESCVAEFANLIAAQKRGHAMTTARAVMKKRRNAAA